MVKKYIYLSDFLSKRLKNQKITLLKNNFLEITDKKTFDIIKLEVDKSMVNIPKLLLEDKFFNNFLQEHRDNKEIIADFSKDILKIDFNDFIKKPENIDELIVFTIALTLNDIYEENQEDLIVTDISRFEPFYQKKKCDLLISNAFLEKYLIILKRVILYEELSFIKNFETKTENLSKADLKNARDTYDSIIRLIEEVRINIESMNLDFPKMRTKLIRGHMLTEKSKPLLELSKSVEINSEMIVTELKIIANNARNRKEFILKELDEKHINWSKIKKKFIEQKLFRLN